jgi:hypothetical protein
MDRHRGQVVRFERWLALLMASSAVRAAGVSRTRVEEEAGLDRLLRDLESPRGEVRVRQGEPGVVARIVPI